MRNSCRRRHCERSEAIQRPWVGAWIASSLRSSQGRVNTYGGWYNDAAVGLIFRSGALHDARQACRNRSSRPRTHAPDFCTNYGLDLTAPNCAGANLDWTIPQGFERYGEADHRIRTTLCERQADLREQHASIIGKSFCGKLTKVFPFAIVTYCVQQTGVYTGGATGVYTGGPTGADSGPNGPVGARPATARPPTPNWPKAAAALALAVLSTALADAKVRGRALSATSPILNIAGPRFFILTSQRA